MPGIPERSTKQLCRQYFLFLLDLSHDPPDQSDPGGFPPQGGPLAVGDATVAQFRGSLIISSAGGLYVGSSTG